MSRVTPDLGQGFSGTAISTFGPRQMGVDADGKLSVATQINAILAALYTFHDNGTAERPSYLPVNGVWMRVNENGDKDLCWWDGQKDNVMATLKADSSFLPSPLAAPPSTTNPNGTAGIVTPDGVSLVIDAGTSLLGVSEEIQEAVGEIPGIMDSLDNKLDTSDYQADAPMRLEASAFIAKNGTITSAFNVTAVTVSGAYYTVKSPAIKSTSVIICYGHYNSADAGGAWSYEILPQRTPGSCQIMTAAASTGAAMAGNFSIAIFNPV